MGCIRGVASDQTDYPPRPMRVTNMDLICLIYSILFHLFDLGTDVKVAWHYYDEGEIYYVVATVLVIFIPSIVTSCVSYRMYTIDGERNWKEEKDEKKQKCGRDFKKNLGIIMLVLQLAPVLRYIDGIKYWRKSRKAEKQGRKEDQEKFYKLMLKEDAEAALLRVFETFLEAAPQQVLQISYLLKGKDSDFIPILSASSSFLGMAMCLLTYQKSIRYVQEDKNNISCIASIFIFMWHLLVATSRILMLGAMVYISWSYALIAMVTHWIIMSVSLYLLESHGFCSSLRSIQLQQFRLSERLANFLFSSVLGLVYIFTYITPGEGGTRFRYTCFYLICFIENVIGALVWYNFSSLSWFTVLLTIMFIAPFVLGCLCMVIYHWKFHPTQYRPPSIMPKKKQNETPEGTHLAETSSPKPEFVQAITNGSATLPILRQGDVSTDTEVETQDRVNL